jgi:hypothetical protein
VSLKLYGPRCAQLRDTVSAGGGGGVGLPCQNSAAVRVQHARRLQSKLAPPICLGKALFYLTFLCFRYVFSFSWDVKMQLEKT